MPFKVIEYKKTSHVMVININYPVAIQLEIDSLTNDLAELHSKIAWDEEIRVIILTGLREKAFSMETHLIEPFSRAPDEPGMKLWSLAEPIAKIGKPVIAAINGDAIGQGLELALACDLRIANEASRFGLPHLKAGLIPWDGGTQRLSRLVGRGKALEMILTGGMIDAQEALRIGLVNRVVSKEDLIKVAMEKAKEMAAKGPIALRYAKEAIYKGMDMTLEQGLRLEADLYLLIHTTNDRSEGIKGFKEKKSPNFKGT